MICCCKRSKTSTCQIKTATDEFADAGFTVERWLSPSRVAKLRRGSLSFTARKYNSEEEAAREREILRRLAAFDTHKNNYSRVVCHANLPRYVVNMYVRGLDLQRVLRGMSPFALRKCLVRVVEIVAQLHDCGIAHLDIKPENIVLRHQKYDQPVLIDFEYAIRVDSPTELKSLPARGTVQYMAPELKERNLAGCPCDVYSLAETIAHCTNDRSMAVHQDPKKRVTARQLLKQLQ